MGKINFESDDFFNRQAGYVATDLGEIRTAFGDHNLGIATFVAFDVVDCQEMSPRKLLKEGRPGDFATYATGKNCRMILIRCGDHNGKPTCITIKKYRKPSYHGRYTKNRTKMTQELGITSLMKGSVMICQSGEQPCLVIEPIAA